MLATFDFEEKEKTALIRICRKYDLVFIQEALKLPGKTVLSAAECSLLAIAARPYYCFLADRIENHPAVRESSRHIPI